MGFREVKLWSRDVEVATSDDTVVMAGQLADNASRESRLRALAPRITAGLHRVDISGARVIAQWVRRHITYRQETPGVEVLQGPYTTLRYRVGDCDDLVILWVALCRAIGIDATFAGVKRQGADGYVHAIGYVPAQRTFYELTDDRTYGGRLLPIVFGQLPAGLVAVFYSSGDGRLLPAAGGGLAPNERVLGWVARPGVLFAALAGTLALLTWRS